MRVGFERLGRRGLALLAATGAAGLILGFHGWSVRGAGLPPGPLAAGSGPAASPRAPAASPRASAAPRPSGSPGRSSSGPHGPLLSSEPYASSAYQIWPHTPSAAAQRALTGLKISVHRQGSGLSVTAGVLGQPASAPHLYPHGARVYVVETSLGDDSGNTDYSLGDDGLVVTSTQGTVIQ
jgi:hypothetical protein